MNKLWFEQSGETEKPETAIGTTFETLYFPVSRVAANFNWLFGAAITGSRG